MVGVPVKFELFNSRLGRKLQVLAELFIKITIVVVILGNSGKHLEEVLHKILLDPAQDFVLL